MKIDIVKEIEQLFIERGLTVNERIEALHKLNKLYGVEDIIHVETIEVPAPYPVYPVHPPIVIKDHTPWWNPVRYVATNTSGDV